MNVERYWLSRGGESLGPFFPGRMLEMWGSGEFGPDDQVCADGTENWMAASEAMLWMKVAVHQRMTPAGSQSTITIPEGAEQWRSSRERERPPKDRGIYLVLGILLGGMGIHNFYVERVDRGFAELVAFAVSMAIMMLGYPAGFVLYLVLMIFVLWETLADFPS